MLNYRGDTLPNANGNMGYWITDGQTRRTECSSTALGWLKNCSLKFTYLWHEFDFDELMFSYCLNPSLRVKSQQYLFLSLCQNRIYLPPVVWLSPLLFGLSSPFTFIRKSCLRVQTPLTFSVPFSLVAVLSSRCFCIVGSTYPFSLLPSI